MKAMLSQLFLTPVLCDAPYPWQISFQDGASPTFEGITELHDSIFFYLVVIAVGVFWALGSTILNFNSANNGIAYKYANHGTLIELVWTITPALVLIAIAFPSFKLLYLMDCQALGEQCLLHLASVVAMPRTRPVPIRRVTSTCTAIVPYGVFGASNMLRLNQHCRNIMWPTALMLDSIIAHMLGDGSLVMSYTSVNPTFVFTSLHQNAKGETLHRFWYVWYVWLNLNALCQKLPTLGKSVRHGVTYWHLQIHTRSYPFLTPLYPLFYQLNHGVQRKVIPVELYAYLNARVLAIWAMDDGSYTPSGFYLHTNGFTYLPPPSSASASSSYALLLSASECRGRAGR